MTVDRRVAVFAADMSPLFRRRSGSAVREGGVQRASVARFGETAPSRDLLASWGGRVTAARDRERWPMGEGGPMLAVLQMNLTEAPFVPDVISEFQLLTVFIGPFRLPNLAEPHAHWSVRGYRDLEALAPLPEPVPARSGDGTAAAPTLRTLPLSWKLVDEQPPSDGLGAEPEPAPEPPAPPAAPLWDDDDSGAFSFATGAATAHAERQAQAEEETAVGGVEDDDEDSLRSGRDAAVDAELVENNDGTKLGGHPKLVTGPLRWAAEDVRFVLQIDGVNPLRLGLGPGGMLYVGYRENDSSWHVTHQALPAA